MELGEGIAVPSGGEPADEGGDEGEGALLRITDVRGLYRPGFHDGVDDRRYGAGDCPGYVSEDDRGRVFINHRPRSSPRQSWRRVRQKNTQYIELTAAVLPAAGPVPADARVRWTWSDPDDPSDAGMHRAAARQIDEQGAAANDNRGRCDYPSRDSESPAYQAIAPYGLANAEGRSCETRVVDRLSRVRLHLSNVGGDNYRVRAELLGVANAAHETGIMTMWKRIDVAYYKMRGDVPELPVADAARELEICFVQLDFARQRDIPYRETLTSSEELLVPTARLVDRVFARAGTPGWFCLIAADLETSALATHPVRTVYDGPAEIVTGVGWEGDWLAVENARAVAPPPGSSNFPQLSEATSARIHDSQIDPVTFQIDSGTPPRANWPRAGWTGFLLVGLDYNSDFLASDGSQANAYGHRTWFYPCRTLHTNYQWSADGLGFGSQVQAEVRTGVNVGASGISPTVRHGGRAYFSGRTVLFTGRFRMHFGEQPRSRPFDRAGALRTIVHEFTHAFGNPHGCGYHSYDGSADAACAMCVLHRWLYRPGTRQLQRGQSGRDVPHLCARHIRAVRETHLEDNPAIWRWP